MATLDKHVFQSLDEAKAYAKSHTIRYTDIEHVGMVYVIYTTTKPAKRAPAKRTK